MDENSVVNYKIYLCAAGYEPEIRRITIGKDISRNYFYLKQKLITIFPTLKDIQFTVSWKDLEGDTVRICSDDELTIALAEMESLSFKKLYIATTPQQGNEGPIHPNVICNGCGHEVQGFRYKCIECPDFDLCADCERGQQHPDHPVLRIPLPLNLESPYCHKFFQKISRYVLHLNQMAERKERRGKGDFSRPENSRKEKRNQRRGCPAMASAAAAATASVSDPLSQLFNFLGVHLPSPREEGPTNGQGDQPSNENNLPSEEHKRLCDMIRQGLSTYFGPIDTENEECDPEGEDVLTTAEGSESEDHSQPQTPREQPQASVSQEHSQPQPQSQSQTSQAHSDTPAQAQPSQTQPQMVQTQPQAAESQPQAAQTQPQSALMQPQVAQTEPQIVQTQPQAAQTQPQASLTQPQVAQMVQIQPPYSASNPPIQLQAAPVQPQPQVQAPAQPLPTRVSGDKHTIINDFVKSLNLGAIPRTLTRGYGFRGEREDSPILDNSWTVIQDAEQPAPLHQSSGSETASLAASVSSVSNESTQNLYPAIPVTPITASGQNIVDETMKQLSEMGFVDEEGWLRQLVESKNGNLNDVLHFLTPIPKPQAH